MSFVDIKKKIEAYDSICIYRHIRADYDALGSQLGLKHLILDNYPEKEVYALGENWIDNESFLEVMDQPAKEVIERSLAIVLDCSNNERIEDGSYLWAKERVKFDHHTNSERLSAIDYVDEQATATCIILTEFAKEMGLRVSPKTAEYLLAGTLTDTQKLTINTVSEKDFQLVGYLLSSGANINEVYRRVFSISKNEFIARSHFASKYVFVKDKAYAVVKIEDYQKYGIDVLKAKEMVDLVREVKGVEQWMLVYQSSDQLYHCSLRSHRVPVAPLARKYGGGGHLCAAGIPNLDEATVQQVIDDFIKG